MKPDDVPSHEYNDVSVESRGLMVPARLKLSDQGIAYRNVKTGKLEQISPDDIDVVNWQRLAGGYGVRLFTSGGTLYRFGGFKESDQSKLEKFFKALCNKTMTEKEFSVKGWNYGAVKFEGGILSFDVSSIPAFEIPVNNVSGCVTGKNEVTLEFHQNDDAAVSLMEMRYHIPASELAGEDPVENFQQRVMAKAAVITATGDALAIFRQVQCLTPRGRYDAKMYPTFIQLHGKTFDFKIPTDTVLRLFLLPHIDGRQHFFVVSLDPPIKQGQTRYPYLILLFQNDEMDEVELPITAEEIKEKYEGRLEKELSGPQFEVISRMFKGLCNRKIVTPGTFVGHSQTPAVGCSYKAAAGYMYPLERGFIYIHKPPIHIRFDEISSINFARSGSTTRSFDFEIEIKNGVIHTFSSIDKGEYHKLYDYVTSKKLRIKNRSKADSVGKKDEFSDSEGDEPDYYRNRVKAEAKERDQDDGDDESEEDSDFNPGEEGSDVAEEFDSNASSSGSDESGGEAGGDSPEKKKKPKEKEHKPKKAKTVSEGPRKKRTKKNRDENQPKRPQSAYLIWLNETRETIKKDNPGISMVDISKKGGMLWKELKDKSDWEKKAAKAKEAYELAMKEFKASGGGAESASAKKSSPKSKKSTPVSSPTKGLGAGSGFKSKEYIEEDSSSSDSEDKPLKKLKSKTGKPKSKKEPKEEKSDAEMESEKDEEEEEEKEEAEESEMSTGADSD